MATGRSTNLTGQVGEFLVCAELGRRGILATPFSGNVPEFDVIAVGEHANTVPVQVKCSNSSTWQLRLGDWLNVSYDRRRRRHVLGDKPKRRLSHLELIFVFVALDRRRSDRFYVLSKWRVRELIYRRYLEIMEPRGYRRPRNPESMHWAISEREMSRYQDNWKLIEDRCRGSRRGRR